MANEPTDRTGGQPAPDDRDPSLWALVEQTLPLLILIMEQEGTDSSTATTVLVLVLVAWIHRQ